MKPVEKNISRVLESVPATIGLVLMAGVLYMLWLTLVPAGRSYEPGGVVAGASQFSDKAGTLWTCANVAAAAISVMMLWMLNRWYFITHSTSKIYEGLYVLGLASVPALCVGLSSGVVMSMALIFCVLMLYTIYQRQSGTRRIFLVFFIIATGSIFDYAYAGFIVPMLLGCGQMRCMSLRSLLAAGMGVATPLWIGWGFGWIDVSAINAPTITLPSPGTMSAQPVPVLILAACAWVVTTVLTVINTMTIYGHNAKTRANNGVLALLSVWTVVAMLIDTVHLMSYLPILIAMMSVQTALCFSLRRNSRGYIAVAAVIIMMISCAIWQLVSI